MRFLQPLLAAVALAAAVSVAPSAMAQRGGQQAATVIVIDYQRIIGTTNVGRDMSTKLQAIVQQMQTELQPDAQSIEQEQQRIQTATQGMTPDQVRANHTLSAQVTAFGQRYEAFRQRQAGLGRDMEYTQQMTLNDFNQQITPSVREVMTARGAGVVLDAAAAQLVLPAYDATNDVVARVNEHLQTMNVTRRQAPTPQQPGQAPAPPQH